MSPERISPPDAFRAQNFWGYLTEIRDIFAFGTLFRPMGCSLVAGMAPVEIFPSRTKAGHESSEKERMMTRKILAALLLTGSLMVAACNTVEGAGKDVQSAGQAVENAAN